MQRAKLNNLVQSCSKLLQVKYSIGPLVKISAVFFQSITRLKDIAALISIQKLTLRI